MSRTKLIIAAVLFLAATCLKFALPSVAGEMREELHVILEKDTDFRGSMTKLGAKLSGDEGLVYALGLHRTGTEDPISEAMYTSEPEKTDVVRPDRPEVLPKLRSFFEKTPATISEPDPEMVEPPVDQVQTESQEAAERREEEVVSAFLASQSAYSDYAVPANVSYAMPGLGFNYVCPVEGMTSSGFGYRVHPLSGDVKFHYGTDFAAWTGTDILCFADGTVYNAGEDTGFGKYIIVDHGNDCRTLYAHCSELLVYSGETVTAGQVIAKVGDTGQVTGPHLHFELTQNDVYLNPEYYVNLMG